MMKIYWIMQWNYNEIQYSVLERTKINHVIYKTVYWNLDYLQAFDVQVDLEAERKRECRGAAESRIDLRCLK